MLSITERICESEEIVKWQFLRALPASIALIITSENDPQLGKLAAELILLPHETFSIWHRNVKHLSDNSYKDKTMPVKMTMCECEKSYRSKRRPKFCRAHIYTVRPSQLELAMPCPQG